MTETTAVITLDNVLSTLVPPTTGYARLVGESGNERFFRNVKGHWRALDQEGQGFDAFITANVDVTFSPIGWATSAVGAITSVSSIWCGIRYGLAAQRAHEPRPRVLDGESDRVRKRLTSGGGLDPSIVVDEGDRAVALWLLERPSMRTADVRPLLLKMARKLGGDPELTDPASALITCPGTHCTRVYPSEPVSVIVCEPERRYDMNTLNAAMKG